MKYWQKTYLATLLLFLVAINLGTFFLYNTSYQTALASERERGFAEHSFISNALQKDMASIVSRNGGLSRPALSSLFQSYAEYYYTQGLFLAIQDPAGNSYTNIPSISPVPASPGGNTRSAVIAAVDGVPYLYISGSIPDMNYSLITARSVAEMQQRAEALSRKLLIESACISVLLAAALFFILKRLTFPIRKLSQAASSLAKGDYGIRAGLGGHDELSELAQNFNGMADEIQSQINALTIETEQKQRFIDDLAHEMRTPLAAIGGYAQYLSNAAITEEERFSALAYITNESKRLAEVSDKLLMLAKLRNSVPEREKVPLEKLFDGLHPAVNHLLSIRGVSLHFEITNAVWQSDQTLLYMLFLNLIQNAINACGEGGSVTVFADTQRVLIKDTGCGMDEASLAHVTEPFYRVDKARSRSEGGSGLGLSICKSICECLRLSLQIKSAPSSGTTVTVLQLDDNLNTIY